MGNSEQLLNCRSSLLAKKWRLTAFYLMSENVLSFEVFDVLMKVVLSSEWTKSIGFLLQIRSAAPLTLNVLSSTKAYDDRCAVEVCLLLRALYVFVLSGLCAIAVLSICATDMCYWNVLSICIIDICCWNVLSICAIKMCYGLSAARILCFG